MKKQKPSQEKYSHQSGSNPDVVNYEANVAEEQTVADADTAHAEAQKQDLSDQSDSHAACQEKLASLEKSLNESNDKFLRLFSEFDNYRKRTTRERLELTKTAGADIITALLPVLDDLERACKMACAEETLNPMLEGMNLILNKFKAVLRQTGVEEIETTGADFDTDYHEAITHVPAPEESQKGKVLEEIQKGYVLHGKVIRYARVVVAN